MLGFRLTHPRKPWITEGFTRQILSLSSNEMVDYVLFNQVYSPVHQVKFLDERARKNFTSLRDKVFQRPDPEAVISLYELLDSYVQGVGVSLPAQAIPYQLFNEYGVDVLQPDPNDLPSLFPPSPL